MYNDYCYCFLYGNTDVQILISRHRSRHTDVHVDSCKAIYSESVLYLMLLTCSACNVHFWNGRHLLYCMTIISGQLNSRIRAIGIAEEAQETRPERSQKHAIGHWERITLSKNQSPIWLCTL